MKVRLLPLFILCMSLALMSTIRPGQAQETEVAAAAPSSSSAAVGLPTVHQVIGLVLSDFRTPVPQSQLVSGALLGLHACLAEHGDNPSPAVVGAATPCTLALLDQRWKLIRHQQPRLSADSLAEAAIRGLLATLKDPYTVFMDRSEYSDMMEEMDGGNFGGLGIYVEQDDHHAGRLTIIEPMEDSPATASGLLGGDVIVKIDGISTAGMTLDDASKRLRGPEGSPVTLTLQREGQPTPFAVTLKRARIEMKTVSHKIIGNIGYVRIRVFGENTGNELALAMRAFDRAQVQGYILDVRNNGGGYVTTALDVCSAFLPTGSRVVSVHERHQADLVFSSLPNIRAPHPVLVLVNKLSASASEITAGALQDLHVGTLLGTRTFGKGSVQKIFPLEGGEAVKITTAHYRTPSGKDIHKVGIQPDIVSDMDPRQVGTSSDRQLAQAVSILQRSLAKPADPETPAAPPGAVRIQGLDDESRIIAEQGSDLAITEQKTMQADDHYYDQVTTRNATDGQVRVFLFDLSAVLGR